MKWSSQIVNFDYFGLFFAQSDACTVIDFTYIKGLNKYIEIIYRNRSKVCRCTYWQWYQLCVCSIRNGPAARNTHIMTQMVTNNVDVWGADADAICSNINTFDNVTLDAFNVFRSKVLIDKCNTTNEFFLWLIAYDGGSQWFAKIKHTYRIQKKCIFYT
jgi:hypothetical protein